MYKPIDKQRGGPIAIFDGWDSRGGCKRGVTAGVRLGLVVVVVAWEILVWMRSVAAALLWRPAKGGWMTVLVLRPNYFGSTV
jgi:hypothetical protein